jgi:transposase
MWTEITRTQHRRDDLRYASDMTDAEWALVEPHMPAEKALGRPRIVPLRNVVDALFYILRTAYPWRLLPHDFPNRSTVQRYFYAWQAEGLWERVNFLLVQHAGKVNGRKRHTITDTNGHLVGVQVHAADIHDRDGAVGVLASIRYLFPWLRHVFADGGYAGEKLEAALAGRGQWTVEIVKRSDQAKGLRYCQGAGWSSEHSPDLAAIGDWPRTSKRLSPAGQAWLYLASRPADGASSCQAGLTSDRRLMETRHNLYDSQSGSQDSAAGQGGNFRRDFDRRFCLGNLLPR